jgi:hypothetical protein
MATEHEIQRRLGQFSALLRSVTDQLGSATTERPEIAQALIDRIDRELREWEAQDAATPPPPDLGLGKLAGVGPEATHDLGETRLPQGVQPYDDQVSAERIIGVGDLYYIYQHERIGVFRVIRKLQELFRAGSVRLSTGEGAFGLYQFDRREVLRYTRNERHSAYRRAFGYGRAPVPTGSRANSEFHTLLGQFVNQVTLYWRDKRISDVMRERAFDPSFGAIAVVRRAGLDLRNNLKFMSFGNINVLRVEVMQVLEEAFRILDADDVKEQFGAATGWDVVEEVLVRYFNERLVTSPRQRMAVTGRDILRWLAQPYILQSQRPQFETALMDIAEPAEEWLTSAQALGVAARTGSDRVLPWDPGRRQIAAPVVPAPAARVNGRRVRRPAPAP